MGALARGHADAIREGFGAEPIDLVGTSTGGSIAQQIAAEYPDVVRRLVLVSTGCRLGPVGRRGQARVADLLRAGDLRAACRFAGASLVPLPFKPFGAAVGGLAAKRVFDSTGAAADLLATLDAEDAFDLTSCSDTIRAPTLIVAGGRDRFYGRDLFEETQQLIPQSRLYLRPHRGHITVTFDRKAVATLQSFLVH